MLLQIIFFIASLFLLTVEPTIRQIDKYDCFGKDLVEKGKILEYDTDTYQGCQDKCVAHRHCTHFGWSKARHNCWLKHANDEPEVERSLRLELNTMCGIISDKFKKPKTAA